MDADENPYKAPKERGTEPPERGKWRPFDVVAIVSVPVCLFMAGAIAFAYDKDWIGDDTHFYAALINLLTGSGLMLSSAHTGSPTVQRAWRWVWIVIAA